MYRIRHARSGTMPRGLFLSRCTALLHRSRRGRSPLCGAPRRTHCWGGPGARPDLRARQAGRHHAAHTAACLHERCRRSWLFGTGDRRAARPLCPRCDPTLCAYRRSATSDSKPSSRRNSRHSGKRTHKARPSGQYACTALSRVRLIGSAGTKPGSGRHRVKSRTSNHHDLRRIGDRLFRAAA